MTDPKYLDWLRAFQGFFFKGTGDSSKLPSQGTIDSGVNGAPKVDTGKQGKHVPGHGNNVSTKLQWPESQNGVQLTQEAWMKGTGSATLSWTEKNRYTYDVWGNPRVVEEQTPNVLRYAGEYWDEETGLQYLRSRWYDPNRGRFINEDTYEGDKAEPSSLNLYTYVENNPLIYTDPNGEAKRGEKNALEGLGSGSGSASGSAGMGRSSGGGLGGGGGAKGGSPASKPKPSTSGKISGSLDGLTKAEKKVVNDLIKSGKNVEVIPKDPKAIEKRPDFKVDGIKTELKTLENPNINTGITRIQKGLKQGAETVIIDARVSGLTTEQAKQIIKRASGTYSNKTIPGKVEIWTNEGTITYP